MRGSGRGELIRLIHCSVDELDLPSPARRRVLPSSSLPGPLARRHLILWGSGGGSGPESGANPGSILTSGRTGGTFSDELNRGSVALSSGHFFYACRHSDCSACRACALLRAEVPFQANNSIPPSACGQLTQTWPALVIINADHQGECAHCSCKTPSSAVSTLPLNRRAGSGTTLSSSLQQDRLWPPASFAVTAGMAHIFFRRFLYGDSHFSSRLQKA